MLFVGFNVAFNNSTMDNCFYGILRKFLYHTVLKHVQTWIIHTLSAVLKKMSGNKKIKMNRQILF